MNHSFDVLEQENDDIKTEDVPTILELIYFGILLFSLPIIWLINLFLPVKYFLLFFGSRLENWLKSTFGKSIGNSLIALNFMRFFKESEKSELPFYIFGVILFFISPSIWDSILAPLIIIGIFSCFYFLFANKKK
eukprot:gene10615-3238_t